MMELGIEPGLEYGGGNGNARGLTCIVYMRHMDGSYGREKALTKAPEELSESRSKRHL